MFKELRERLIGKITRKKEESVPIHGRVYYVSDKYGDDGADGLDPVRPLKTIVKAMSLYVESDNDQIVVFQEEIGDV